MDIDITNNQPYYKLANLKNTLEALAALFVIEMNFYKDIVTENSSCTYYLPVNESVLFAYNGWHKFIKPLALSSPS